MVANNCVGGNSELLTHVNSCLLVYNIILLIYIYIL